MEHHSYQAWRENQINARKQMNFYQLNYQGQPIELYCALENTELFYEYNFHPMVLLMMMKDKNQMMMIMMIFLQNFLIQIDQIRHLQSGPGSGPGPGPVGTGTGSGPKFQVLTGPGRDRDQNFIFYRDRDGTKISSWSRKCF